MPPVELFGAHDDEQDQPPVTQDARLDLMMQRMTATSDAVVRASQLVMNIIKQNSDRMMLDENQDLVITGRLAFYKVDLNAFMAKFTNPFCYNSFDVVEVHPKSGMVKEPKTACVQVLPQENMPAYDLLGGYLLGLLNDDTTWLQEALGPLRRTLMDLYGLAPSPLSESLTAHFKRTMNGMFDFRKDTFTFNGTNGWQWRLTFGRPKTQSFRIEYQKPRQTWWNPMFENHLEETTGHFSFATFLDTVEHLAACPAMLKTCREWESDPIFVRKVAVDYPPLARIMIDLINEEKYNPEEIYTYYDDVVSQEEASIIQELDRQISRRALAF